MKKINYLQFAYYILLSFVFMIQISSCIPTTGSNSASDSIAQVNTTSEKNFDPKEASLYDEQGTFIPESSDLIAQEKTVTVKKFYPTEATFCDDQGTFTSESFDCPPMDVYDNGNYVDIYWGGNTLTINKNEQSPDTYDTFQTYQGHSLHITACRHAQTQEIYLINITDKYNGESTSIKFNP